MVKRPWDQDSERRPWQKPSKPFGASRYDGAFYNSPEWRKFRSWYAAHHAKVCVVCGREAKYLDHIIPISQGGARLDENNVQWLCVRCNAAKTNKDRMKLK